jgi:selenocysteine lyase/cysteine desulfurase
MLSATGRKYLRGPRGTGFLYVQRDWIERLTPPLLDLHAATLNSPTSYRIRSDAKRFETWEGYVAGKIALGVAVDYALDWGMDAISERVQHVAGELREALRAQRGVTVYDAGTQQCGIVTFAIDGTDAHAIQHRLRTDGINVSVSTPASTLLDAKARDLPKLVRASVHYYNTDTEVERFVATLNQRFPVRMA